MQKRRILLLLIAPILVPAPTFAQATMEFGGVQAGAIGLGAGLAASRGHGQVVRRSYEAVVQAEQATLAQTKAIEQYMKTGCELESKKRWADAEKSFTYVLKVVALRDGPGSIKSVPALHHLVTVTKEQGKIAEAVNFQKTVVAFTKSVKMPDQQAVLKEQIDLTNLFILKNDYVSAEPILRETVTSNPTYQKLPVAKRRVTLSSYAKVLRKLNKDAEAEQIEAEEAKAAAPEKTDVATDKTDSGTPTGKPANTAPIKTDVTPTDSDPAKNVAPAKPAVIPTATTTTTSADSTQTKASIQTPLEPAPDQK